MKDILYPIAERGPYQHPKFLKENRMKTIMSKAFLRFEFEKISFDFQKIGDGREGTKRVIL